MFFKNDSNQSLKSKTLAEQLHDQRQIYYSYAALDALSSSYSMFKYFYDVWIGGSADDMHDFMLTPQCIAGIALECFILAGFFVSASYFDRKEVTDTNKKEPAKKNKNPFSSLVSSGESKDKKLYQESIRDAGPYVRDIMKGLKNAYKGWRSTVVAINLLHLVQLNVLIFPIGISLGVLGAINRCMIRTVRESRKAKGEYNDSLRKYVELMNFIYPSPIDLAILFNDDKQSFPLLQTPPGFQRPPQLQGRPRLQEFNERVLGIFYALFGGFVDGLYLYAGALTLSVLAPQLLIAMGLLCSLYTIACIATRVDEEYKYQQKLLISYHKCWLSIYEKQIQKAYSLALDSETPNDIIKNRARLCELINEFEKEHNALKQCYKTNYGTAFMLGIKNSLFAYSALSSILFFSSSMAALGGVVFPPLIVVFVVCSGIALMAGFIAAAMRSHYLYTQQNKDELKEYQALVRSAQSLKELSSSLPDVEIMNQALSQGKALKPESEIDVQNELEVIRCFFSGLGKGQKFIDFICNGLQEKAADGHYHDTPIMFVLSALSAALFSTVLSLRALARGFGKPQKMEDEKKAIPKISTSPLTSSLSNTEQLTPFSSTVSTTPETRSQPSPGRMGMFRFRRCYSENDISNPVIDITMDTMPLNRQHHTVADLTAGRCTS